MVFFYNRRRASVGTSNSHWRVEDERWGAIELMEPPRVFEMLNGREEWVRSVMEQDPRRDASDPSTALVIGVFPLMVGNDYLMWSLLMRLEDILRLEV